MKSERLLLALASVCLAIALNVMADSLPISLERIESIPIKMRYPKGTTLSVGWTNGHGAECISTGTQTVVLRKSGEVITQAYATATIRLNGGEPFTLIQGMETANFIHRVTLRYGEGQAEHTLMVGKSFRCETRTLQIKSVTSSSACEIEDVETREVFKIMVKAEQPARGDAQ